MPGFLGATSFSAVLTETRDTLTSAKAPPELIDGAIGFQDDQDGFEVRRKPLNPQNLELCLRILTHLPDQRTGHLLFHRHKNPCDGWMRQAGPLLWDSVWEAFHSHLADASDTAKLTEMATIISANTEKILCEDHRDPRAWYLEFSGRNLRWDAIGILFTYWAFGSVCNSEAEWHAKGLGLPFSGRRHFMVEYHGCASSCMSLCSRSSNNSSLLGYVLYKYCILQSLKTGDASLALWRQHSNLVASTTFLGLHSLSDQEPSNPTISSEIRRRLFSQVFVIDKVIATFNGRPPLLARRYSTTPMPLDISDDILMSSHAALIQAANNLDANGWNRDGKIYSTTIIRARYLMARVRDAILETALGNWQTVQEECVLKLKSEEISVFRSLPKFIMYDPRQVADPASDIALLNAKILVLLEHLQNIFFIERLIRRAGQDNQTDLLVVSYELVTTTLTYWKNHDRFIHASSDFAWLVMSYAAPASGILCMELLQPRVLSTRKDGGITRSGIVQQLSLLTAFLDWVQPWAPNSNLCGNVKSIITRVLDQTLNAGILQGPPAAAWDIDFETDQLGLGSFDLWDTFDWLHSDLPMDRDPIGAQ